MATAAAVGFSVASSYLAGEAEKQAANYNNMIAQSNAKMLEIQAERVLDRGEKDVTNYKNSVNQMISDQRLGFSASNIDINTGTALAVQEETANMGMQDALTIKNNAFLEAMGYKQNAINTSFAGKAGVMSANNRAVNSLITSGFQGFAAGGGFDKKK